MPEFTDLLPILTVVIGEIIGAFCWVIAGVALLVIATVVLALCASASDADDEIAREQNDWRGV